MTIELEADVFDTLELSALVYGGIGAFAKYDTDSEPLCIVGHVAAAQAVVFAIETALGGPVFRAGLTPDVSDPAVERILSRKRARPHNSRVSWSEYAKELSIVRKESR